MNIRVAGLLAKFCPLLILAMAGFDATAGDLGTNRLLFLENFDRDLGGRWEQLRFGQPTVYSIVSEDGIQCLRAEADRTCSALMARVDLRPSGRLMARWRWKIGHTPTNATDRIAASFDHAARVIIAFDTFIGPPRTLNYVWANRERVGAAFAHPLSARAQMIALESGDERANSWVTEERDVTADWHRLFGDKAMPDIVAVGVITDSANTKSKVRGFYADLELLQK